MFDFSSGTHIRAVTGRSPLPYSVMHITCSPILYHLPRLSEIPNAPASSRPPQKPLRPLADSTLNLTPYGADRPETPALIHQPNADNLHPWFPEFQSPPRSEFLVKGFSTEPLTGQKPLPSPLLNQSDCAVS